jgi:hypothetical protein
MKNPQTPLLAMAAAALATTLGASSANAQTFSLESAVLDSRTSRNLGVTTERGELAALFRAQKALTFGILRASGIALDQLPPDVRSRIERFQTTNLEAFRAFSSGLDLKDQGRFAEAKEAFRRAAELDPGFALAREQQQAMPDTNALNPVQLRAVIAANASAAVDRGKATFAVDLSRAMAAMQAGAQVVAVALPAADSGTATRLDYRVNESGSGPNFSPNLAVALSYNYTAAGGTPIGIANSNEWAGGKYATSNNALDAVGAVGDSFQARRESAAVTNTGSATLSDGTRAYWGSWASAPGASAGVTISGSFVRAPTLGPVDWLMAEATSRMPTASSVVFTPTGGSLQNVSGTIGVNFTTRAVTLNNLGFDIGALSFSGLQGNATYSDRVASGVFGGNYTAGSCTGCAAFAPLSSAFSGNFAGRDANGLLFSTFLLTGNGTVSGVQLFQRP